MIADPDVIQAILDEKTMTAKEIADAIDATFDIVRVRLLAMERAGRVICETIRLTGTKKSKRYRVHQAAKPKQEVKFIMPVISWPVHTKPNQGVTS